MMGHVKVMIAVTGHALPGWGGVTRSAIILFTNPRTSSSIIVLDGLCESWDTGSCPALSGHSGKTVLPYLQAHENQVLRISRRYDY